MRRADRLARWVFCVLLVVAWQSSPGQSLDVPRDDGWYSWDVVASTTAAGSCCWHSNRDSFVRGGCDLDGERGQHALDGDCTLESDRLRVYVRLAAGRPDVVRALNANCPVTTKSAVRDLGSIDTTASVAWLSKHIGTGGRGDDDELLAAIVGHEGDAAFRTLTGLVEDRMRSQRLREQALFWLAQSDSDEAFRYLDRLLSRR